MSTISPFLTYFSISSLSMKYGLTACAAGPNFASSTGKSLNIPAHSGLTAINGSLNSAVAD